MPERENNVPDEANEFKSHKPEDLLETEGPNKGNIKDKELAQIGAEAEDRLRSGTMYNLKRLGEAIMGGNQAEKDADRVGEEAMKDEINRRIAVKGKAKNLSPKAIKDEQDAATDYSYSQNDKSVFTKQAELTRDRVDAERKEL